MTYTNEKLIKRFVRGAENGKSNRMAIEALDNGWTLLWGYGWALYGARSPNEVVYIYMGWYGYSNTTSAHMNKLKDCAETVYGEAEPMDQLRVIVSDGLKFENYDFEEDCLIVENDSPRHKYNSLRHERPELKAIEDQNAQAPNGQAG